MSNIPSPDPNFVVIDGYLYALVWQYTERWHSDSVASFSVAVPVESLSCPVCDGSHAQLYGFWAKPLTNKKLNVRYSVHLRCDKNDYYITAGQPTAISHPPPSNSTRLDTIANALAWHEWLRPDSGYGVSELAAVWKENRSFTMQEVQDEIRRRAGKLPELEGWRLWQQRVRELHAQERATA